MSACRICEASTDGFLCKPCLHELERAIGDMPSLMHEVSVVALGQTRVYRSSKPAEPETDRWYDPEADLEPFLRSPHGRTALKPTRLIVNLDAREALWVAGNTLSSWARHIAEQRGAELPDAKQLVGWLLRYVESVRWDEAAGEMHEEITYLHRQLERAVDRSPSRIYAGPCQADGCQRDLYAWPSADAIECDGYRDDGEGCGAVHTFGERREWLLAAIDDALLPLTTWQEALPRMFPELTWPTRSTWWRWVNTGRLSQHAADRVGIGLYAGGEVIRLVRDEQPRIIGNRTTRRTA